MVALLHACRCSTSYIAFRNSDHCSCHQRVVNRNSALEKFDALAMPTIPFTATLIPPPDAPLGSAIDTALNMQANTCSFDVSGHPAFTVPCGRVNGLPVGLIRQLPWSGIPMAIAPYIRCLVKARAPAPMLSARRYEGDGLSARRGGCNGACTFHPFVHGTTYAGAVSLRNTGQLHDEATGGGLTAMSMCWELRG